MAKGTIFSNKPTLTGAHVVLRSFAEADIPIMLAILEDAELRILTGSVHTTAEANAPTTDAERQRSIQWYQTRNQQPNRLDLGIVHAATGNLIGEVVLNDWDTDNMCCNFRILIGPRGRNAGLGSEATALLLDYAFQVLRLHRVELTVFDFNPRARHVYEKAGFVHEGTRREAFCFDGQWHDELLYSILADDKTR